MRKLQAFGKESATGQQRVDGSVILRAEGLERGFQFARQRLDFRRRDPGEEVIRSSMLRSASNHLLRFPCYRAAVPVMHKVVSMQTTSLNAKNLALLLLLAAIWGGSFLFLRICSPALGAVPTAFGRVLISARSCGRLHCLSNHLLHASVLF